MAELVTNKDLQSAILGADPSSLTMQLVLREVGAAKDLFATQLGSLQKIVDAAHADLVRVPTDTEKAITALKELQDGKFDSAGKERALIRDVIETRFNGMDKAINLLQAESNQFPHRIDEKITALEKVHSEKFNSIDKQFGERDVRTQQAAEASTTAVNAALQAQKESAGKQAEAFQEATSKSEQQFTKQIDQQGELLRTEVRGLVTQINELKDRFNRGEGKGEGTDKSKNDSRLWLGVLIAAAGILIGVSGIIITVLLRKP